MKAVAEHPEDAAQHTNLGAARLLIGQINDAIRSLDKAIALDPKEKHAYNNLGIALSRLGKTNKAISHFETALELDPEFAEAHCNLGEAIASKGDYPAALASFLKGLELNPDYTEGWNNLGLVQCAFVDYKAAINSFHHALRLTPNAPLIYNNLGTALRSTGAFKKAQICYERAIALLPDFPEAHHNLGLALLEQHLFDNAEEHFRRSLDIDPDFVKAQINLAALLTEQNRFDEAKEWLKQALASEPDDVDANYAWAVVHLKSGDLEIGLKAYEIREGKNEYDLRNFALPRWDGTPHPEKHLMVYTEQGIGDTLQFVRFASLAKARVKSLTLETPPRLIPILSRCKGIDSLVPQGQPIPQASLQIPLMSLPHVLGTTLETIPGEVPYIFPDDKLVMMYRKRLSHSPQFKIGICWHGKARHLRSIDHRNIPPAHFARLTNIPNTEWFSLLKSSDPILTEVGVHPLDANSDTCNGAFMDTAALMMNLDLIITSDTSIVHLAGGLGLPVWLALAANAEWRWFSRREDSPFYPNMRLFRQHSPGDWTEVFSRMREDLNLYRRTLR